jgi:hypothetical protein
MREKRGRRKEEGGKRTGSLSPLFSFLFPLSSFHRA